MIISVKIVQIMLMILKMMIEVLILLITCKKMMIKVRILLIISDKLMICMSIQQKNCILYVYYGKNIFISMNVRKFSFYGYP